MLNISNNIDCFECEFGVNNIGNMNYFWNQSEQLISTLILLITLMLII